MCCNYDFRPSLANNAAGREEARYFTSVSHDRLSENGDDKDTYCVGLMEE